MRLGVGGGRADRRIRESLSCGGRTGRNSEWRGLRPQPKELGQIGTEPPRLDRQAVVPRARRGFAKAAKGIGGLHRNFWDRAVFVPWKRALPRIELRGCEMRGVRESRLLGLAARWVRVHRIHPARCFTKTGGKTPGWGPSEQKKDLNDAQVVFRPVSMARGSARSVFGAEPDSLSYLVWLLTV